MSKENALFSAGVAVATVAEGSIFLFLCVGRSQGGDGFNILEGYSEAMEVVALEQITLPSSMIESCTATRNYNLHERGALSDIIHISAIFAFLATSAYQCDVEATFGVTPALFVSGAAGIGKTHTIDDAVVQLQGLGVYAACCDAEVVLDEALFIEESRMNGTDNWQMPSFSLHDVMVKAAATSGLIILENFGSVIRAARLATATGGTLHRGPPNDCLQRSGAALRISLELEKFSQSRDCAKIAGIIVISDESLESYEPEIITPPLSFVYPFLNMSHYEVVIRFPTADDITRASVCAARLNSVFLEADIDVKSLALSFAPNLVGYLNDDIAITIDAAILFAAVRAGSNDSISLRWDDIADAILLKPPCRFKPLLGEDVPRRSVYHNFLGSKQDSIPTPQWHGIGGCHSAKYELEKAVLWPRTRTTEFQHFGLNSCRGVILHGPPGNGKTLLARGVANETKATFVGVRSGELVQPYLGESEAAVRELFAAARETASCILYFDEVDAIGTARGDAEDANGSTLHARLVATLLSELDGLHKKNEDVAR